MNIKNVEIVDELKQSYLDYAMDVIVDRALPDARDGLKPVHRRVLYAMYEQKIFHTHATVKSARVVGDVIGKYHPHGDSAVYDTMVRMAQNFSLRYPLIEGQGNFGSIDNDPAAAMRYTEVRLQKISDEILADLDKETVDLKPNYDSTLMIPDYVLPTKIPNLLVNGSSGIAVGLATNIPSHNLTEVLNGVLALLDNPDLSNKDLMSYVTGPDFPTGGIIYGREGILSAYTTGKGRVILRAKYHVETAQDGRQTIVIDELPYGVVKIELVRQIINLVNEKKITGISDVCDRSGKDVGIRVEIELKQGEFAEVVINHLFKLSMMQSSFPVNIVAIVDGRPMSLTLKDCLACFINHRKEVVTRRYAFELRKARDHAHLIEGQLAAQDNLDEVVKLIRSSQTREEAKTRLLDTLWKIHEPENPVPGVDTFATLLARCGNDCRPLYVGSEYGFHNGYYKLTPEQVENILSMRLSQLVRLAKEDLFQQYQVQAGIVIDCLRVLGSSEELCKEIKKELIEIREIYGDDRRTEIVQSEASIEIEDLITPREVVVTLSKAGYIKYQPVEDYNAHSRGGVGRKGAALKEDDAVYKLTVTNNKDYLLCFTNLGRVYCIKTYQLPEGSFYSKGRPIVNIIPVADNEKVTAMLPIHDFNEGKYVILATREGFIKKVKLSEFSKLNKTGKRAITFRTETDCLIGVDISDGNNDVLIFSANGRVIRFNELKNAPQSPFVLEKITETETENEEEEIVESDENVETEESTDVDDQSSDEEQSCAELVRCMGCQATGVKGIKLIGDDYVVALIVPKIEKGNRVLLATENGLAARIQIARIPRKLNRAAMGVKSLKIDEVNGKMVSALQVDVGDQLMIINSSGNIIRTYADQVRETGRGSRGVKLVRLTDDTKVIAVERVTGINIPENEDSSESKENVTVESETVQNAESTVENTLEETTSNDNNEV